MYIVTHVVKKPHEPAQPFLRIYNSIFSPSHFLGNKGSGIFLSTRFIRVSMFQERQGMALGIYFPPGQKGKVAQSEERVVQCELTLTPFWPRERASCLC